MNTNEDDPLPGFNVEKFLSALERNVRSGKKTGDASDSHSVEDELNEKEKLRSFHIGLLSSFFSSVERPIREQAQNFKTFFDNQKSIAAQTAQFSPKNKWLIMNTTIDNLAQTAFSEYETYDQRCSQAIPGSIEVRLFQDQAERWVRIYRVINAASKIKD